MAGLAGRRRLCPDSDERGTGEGVGWGGVGGRGGVNNHGGQRMFKYPPLKLERRDCEPEVDSDVSDRGG